MNERQKEYLEIYKIHTEFADRVSQRREKANHLFIGSLTGILVFFTTFLRLGTNTGFSFDTILAIVAAIGVLGVFLTIAWYITIQSYRQLNTGKFNALHELEGKLAYPFFKREWEILGEGGHRSKYWKLTVVETFLPVIFFVFFLAVSIFSIISLC